MSAVVIPKPEVLNPHRILENDVDNFFANHEARAGLLNRALHDSCSYGEQLWDTLDTLRRYLLDSLPPDRCIATASVVTGAGPTGPDDDEGWQGWMTAFTAATSTLCGPHGDSGFGAHRARVEAQRRRH